MLKIDFHSKHTNDILNQDLDKKMPFLNFNKENLFAEHPSQDGYLKTNYTCELTKKSEKFTDENNNFMKSKSRNNDICYFKDILSQYQKRKTGGLLMKYQQFDIDESKKIIKSNFPIKLKTINRNTNKKIINNCQENWKDQRFSQTMENYYSNLNNLKNKHSKNNSKSKEDKFRAEIPFLINKNLPDKISDFFGIDQNNKKLTDKDLNIFKNLHQSSNQSKENLPNLMSNKKIISVKNSTKNRKKTTDELLNFQRGNFTKKGYLASNFKSFRDRTNS